MFRVQFSENDSDFRLQLGELYVVTEQTGDYPIYTGETTVTPAVEEQTLQSKKTVLMQDITVKKIPISDVSNTSGGITVTIG